MPLLKEVPDKKLLKAKITTNGDIERFDDDDVNYKVKVQIEALEKDKSNKKLDQIGQPNVQKQGNGTAPATSSSCDTPNHPPSLPIEHVKINSKENKRTLSAINRTRIAENKLWAPHLPKYEKSRKRKSIFPPQPASNSDNHNPDGHHLKQILTRRQAYGDAISGYLPLSPPQRSKTKHLNQKELGKRIYAQDKRFGNSPALFRKNSKAKANTMSNIISTFHRALRPTKPKPKTIQESPKAMKQRQHNNSISLRINITGNVIQESDPLKNYKTFLMRPPSGPSIVKATVYDRHNMPKHSDSIYNDSNSEGGDGNDIDINKGTAQNSIVNSYNQNSCDRWFNDDEQGALVDGGSGTGNGNATTTTTTTTTNNNNSKRKQEETRSIAPVGEDGEESMLGEDNATSVTLECDAMSSNNMAHANSAILTTSYGSNMLLERASIIAPSVENISFDKVKVFIKKPEVHNHNSLSHQKHRRRNKPAFNLKFVGGDKMDLIISPPQKTTQHNENNYCGNDINAFQRSPVKTARKSYIKPNLPHKYTVQQVVPTMNRRAFAYTFPDWHDIDDNKMSPRTLEDVIDLRLSKWLDPVGEYSPRRNPVKEREQVIQRYYDDVYLHKNEQKISEERRRMKIEEMQSNINRPVANVHITPVEQHEIAKAKKHNLYHNEADLSKKLGAALLQKN